MDHLVVVEVVALVFRLFLLLSVVVTTGLKLGLRAASVSWCGERSSRSAPSAWAISEGFCGSGPGVLARFV
jgi:hypothetical protein